MNSPGKRHLRAQDQPEVAPKSVRGRPDDSLQVPNIPASRHMVDLEQISGPLRKALQGSPESGAPRMKPIRNLRWWIVSLLFLATVINYLDRQTLSVLAPTLEKEFGLTNTDYSRILFGFMLAYTVMQVGSGRIMDWLGTRRGFSWTISWWSGAAMLHVACSSAWQFGICRFLGIRSPRLSSAAAGQPAQAG